MGHRVDVYLRLVITEINMPPDKVNGVCPQLPIECLEHFEETRGQLACLLRIEGLIGEMRGSLVGPATSKDQVKTSFVITLFKYICGSFAVAFAVMGILLVLQWSSSTGKNVKAGPSGIEVTQQEQPTSVQKKTQNDNRV